MNPVFFKNQAEFRNWLEENHLKEPELIVGFYKVNSLKHNMTWSQSVDQALCFGWIDSVRKSIDEESYCIRFTPRKSTSIWSEINIKKVEELSKLGLMQPAGLEIFNNRKVENSMKYSFENDSKEFPDIFEELFMQNQKAWIFFLSQTPSYKKTVIHWILSPKQESSKLSRLNKVIVDSESHKRLWEKYK
ncbi:MAG: YdeI/OmpD-associated family protein [Paludibacter sp.]